jgi:Rrf2 family iron-sulfur cluster assembly transcriptional regulator
MKLTTKGRYAVMAMADIASYSDQKPISLTEISLRQNISLSYLEQLFLKLKSRNLVKSIRGSSGGYVLVKPASEIKLSNIIFAVDEKVETLKCTHKNMKCITHNFLDYLEKHINNFFEKKKLEDLVNKSEYK